MNSSKTNVGTTRILAAFFGIALAHGQTTSPPGATTKAGNDNDTVLQLSPFEVSSEKDVGYEASNTTSGSRLNTKLKDTSAPVSVFTQEFLSDFGLNNIEDAMNYSVNFERDYEDSNAGFNAPSARGSSAATPPFRIRGLIGTFAVDLIESAVPQDIYNIDRFEVSSGPNSVLFGLGAAGGTIALTTKQADSHRSFGHVKTTLGSWNFDRNELDVNRVLIKNKLAVRLNALETHNNGWRTYDFASSKRIAAALTYNPFKNTSIHLDWDGGDHGRHTDWPWPAGDGLRGWVAAGSPRVDISQTPFNAATFSPLGINRVATSPTWTFIDNNNAVVNMQNQLQSYTGVKPNGVAYSTDGILTPNSPPAYVSFSGPGSFLHGFYRNYSARFEQRIGKLAIEGAYLYTFNHSYANGWAVPGNSINLRGDPNAKLPVPTGGTAANPNAGGLYIENNWRPEDTAFSNQVYRVTSAYELDLGKWFGRHKLASLLETGKVEQNQHVYTEILVDQNNLPISNVNPENANNQLIRRNYVTPGDYSTYYMGDVRTPFPGLTIGSNTYHARDVALGQNNTSDDLKLTDTLMLADQAYFWHDKIIVTAGYRWDTVKFKNGLSARIPSTDPSVQNGQHVANEWVQVPGGFSETSYKPHTFTAGVMYHVTSHFSAFYNQSDNVGAPNFNAFILPPAAPPTNVAAPATKGKSHDFGVILDLFGDDRYSLRLTRFDSQYLDSTPVQPSNNPFQATQVLGLGLDALVAAGRISSTQAAQFRVSPTAFSVDVASKGYEAEAIANPNRNISIRADFSYSDRNRENFFQEQNPFVPNLAAFLSKVDSTGVFITSTYTQYTTGAIDPARNAKDSILQEVAAFVDTTSAAQEQAFGSRPYKLNIDGRYRFTDGRLKGLSVGGAVRWQSDNYMQTDLRQTLDGGVANPNYGMKFYGHTQEAWDFFTAYRTKVPFMHGDNVTFQINVRNAFNQSRVLPARYTNDFLALRRVYLNDPRTWRFSVAVDF